MKSRLVVARCSEDEMVGWHYWLNGHEFEQTLGDSKGQGSLVCSRPWSYKGLDMTSVQFSSVAQSYLTLCDPMDCSTPDFPVHQQLPGLAQIHVHRASVAIQSSHPLSSPSLPAFNLSQHQGFFLMSWLFSLGGQIIGAWISASVLLMNIHDWFPLELTDLISL